MHPIAAAFQVMSARVFNQNAPHQLGRNRKKMCAVLPIHSLVIHQAHVGFIDQSGGLQAVTGTLTSHVASRQTVEFVIDDWSQTVERRSISITPGPEKLGYLATRWLSGPVALRL
jgi:hypothetical protein